MRILFFLKLGKLYTILNPVLQYVKCFSRILVARDSNCALQLCLPGPARVGELASVAVPSDASRRISSFHHCISEVDRSQPHH